MNRLQALGCFSLGILVTMGAALLIGATRADEPQVGRYQISNSDHHAFIIDTANGTVIRRRLFDKTMTGESNQKAIFMRTN